MNLSPLIITSYIIFLFHKRVSSSEDLSSKLFTYSEVKFENVLRKFFVQLNEVYLRNHRPRHVTIVGASENDFQQTEPLIESIPYIVCKDTEKCGYSQRFSQGGFVVVFLEDLSEKSFNKNIHVLSCSSKSRILFVSNGTIKIKEVLSIFHLAWKYNAAYSELVNIKKNTIEIYSDLYTSNCTIDVQLAKIWRPGVALNAIKIWVFRLRDMNGCPVSVSSLLFTPKMMIEEHENGSLRITGGREGNLILALAEKLNFTVALRYPSLEDQLKYSRKVAIMNDVSSGISEIGIGRLRPTNDLNHTIIASASYDEECITWGIPRVMIWSSDILNVEFTWEVWLSVVLVFVMSCVIGYVYRNIISSMIGTQSHLELIKIILDTVAINLGNPVLYVSSSPAGRLMLTAYLYYAMVITTAYKSSLASILTTDESRPKIVDAQGIINANLNVGGSLYDYNILRDQVNDSELTAKLLERFVINNNDSMTWDQMMFDHDYAYLSRRSSLIYDRQKILKAQEAVTYDVLDGCVLAYPTVMVFQLKSFLRQPVDNIIQRLTESGILKHWDIEGFNAEKMLKRRNAELYYEDRAAYKFRNIFVLYGFCMGLSAITFVMEILFAKLYSNRRQQ